MGKVSDECSNMYENITGCFSVRTKNGLKTQVYYKEWNNGNYAIYPQGNKTYGIIAFYIYIYNIRHPRLDPPNIVKVGSVSKDLTYLGK